MSVTQPPYLRFDPATQRARIDPREPDFVQEPYAAYAFLHENAPAFFWEDYGFWCFAGHDDVNRLLRDRRFGRENRWGPPGITDERRAHLADFDKAEASSLLELEPPAHTRLRAQVNRAFVSRQVERLRPRIAALANELIDRIETQGGADMLPAIATPVPITVIAEMLGVPVEMGPRLLEWSHRMVEMYTLRATRETEERANQAAREFGDFICRHAEERRRNPGDDLLSLLIAAREEGRKLNEDELVSSVILLLNAGHEATVHQTGNAIRAILLQGGDPRRFFATPEATAATVEECLRHDAPLHMFTRFAYETVELADGVKLEPGDRIGLLLGAANRDPTSFDAPASFNPGRADQKNVSFGAGIHFCIGAPLARIELQETLRVLFERLPGIRLAGEPRYRDSYHFHGLERLECAW
ncbi:MAG: cytochrome P450 [Rhizobiaceae bacterium]